MIAMQGEEGKCARAQENAEGEMKAFSCHYSAAPRVKFVLVFPMQITIMCNLRAKSERGSFSRVARENSIIVEYSPPNIARKKIFLRCYLLER